MVVGVSRDGGDGVHVDWESYVVSCGVDEGGDHLEFVGANVEGKVFDVLVCRYSAVSSKMRAQPLCTLHCKLSFEIMYTTMT